MSAKNPKPIQRVRKPSQRDIEIVRAISDFHVLRQDQLQRLFFRSPSTTSQVLSRLCEREYIDFKLIPVIRGQGSSPKFYVLDRRGADLLELEGWSHAKKDLKDVTFLEHLTGINDFLITV